MKEAHNEVSKQPEKDMPATTETGVLDEKKFFAVIRKNAIAIADDCSLEGLEDALVELNILLEKAKKRGLPVVPLSPEELVRLHVHLHNQRLLGLEELSREQAVKAFARRKEPDE